MRRSFASRRALARTLALVTCSYLSSACLERPISPNEPRTTTGYWDKRARSAVDKIDILLVIDDSSSMGDKQKILAAAVPDLVGALANPPCVNPETESKAGIAQPASPIDPCPAGTVRDFEAVTDIHVGIVSSSLGGINNACSNAASLNDKAHLLDLKEDGTAAKTYVGQHFLAWDPKQKLPKLDASGHETGEVEPGEADLLADTSADGNDTALLPTLTDMVTGVGQTGCGYEGTLEAAYRFLVDPAPPLAIKTAGYNSYADGVDQDLLAQRRAFLRPDSLVAVVILSDENDCSVTPNGLGWVALESSGSFARARQECEANPYDECCRSCAEDQTGCPVDPTCTDANGNVAKMTLPGVDTNMLCHDSKRRFGIDLLAPISRYTAGFRDPQITLEDGSIVDNPLFVDLNPNDSLRGPRPADMVFVAGIVGVPWQDIARDPADLTKGFKNAEELAEKENGVSTWDIILGEPSKGVKPLDPLMIESIDPRTGTNPVTGEKLAAPGEYQQNEINGNEFSVPNKNELQYACIFPLAEPRFCDGKPSCDCSTPGDKPVCDDTPGNENWQTHAKAYPGVRQLELIRSLDKQGVVGSVCPAQSDDLLKDDYGYRPAVGALIDRLKERLRNQCVPRQLAPDSAGKVPCVVLELRNTQGSCSCDLAARLEVTSEHEALAEYAFQDPISIAAGFDCACEVEQLTGDALNACQNDTSLAPQLNGEPVDGYCYIDAMRTPTLGNADLVADCPNNEKHALRFVGEGNAVNGAINFIACVTDSG